LDSILDQFVCRVEFAVISVRRMQLFLIVGNLAALGCAVAALGVASLMPLPAVPDSRELALPSASVTTPASVTKPVQVADWEPYWQTPLRRPLVDPLATPTVTAAPAPKPPPRPKLNVRVIGTILEHGAAIALLQVGTSDVQLRKAGEAVEGVADCQVLEIAAKTVKLRHVDHEVTLELLPDRP
jgi:hypothetical protein